MNDAMNSVEIAMVDITEWRISLFFCIDPPSLDY
jgi:hypothetical protein